MHRWWVFLHIAGAFGFLMAHGVSAYVVASAPARSVTRHASASCSSSRRLRSASCGIRSASCSSAGSLAGFTGHFWGQGWIWAAIVILVVVMVAMYAMGTTWAKRLRTISGAMVGGTEAVSRSQFEDILRSKRPYTIAAIGFVGLLAILWLMIFKPTLGFGGVPECPAGTDTVTVCAFDDQAFVPEHLRLPGERAGGAGVRQSRRRCAAQRRDLPGRLRRGVAVRRRPDRGAETVTYDVPALDPGEYYFRCDVHPQMDGSVEVA